MTRSLAAVSALMDFEESNPAFSRLPTLHELFATLLDEARQCGASVIDITYDAKTNLVRMHDDGSMAAGPRTLSLLRDTLAAGPVDYACTRSDLHRFLAILSCSRRLTVETAAHSITLSAAPELRIERIKPRHSSPAHRGATLTFELIQPLPVSTKGLRDELEKLAKGFPLDICFNGESISRPFSVGTREFKPFTHGLFLVDDVNLPHSHEVFLNGLPIEKAGNRDTYLPNGFIVHLHPEIFQASAPAKNVLTGGELTLSFLRHELHLVTGVY